MDSVELLHYSSSCVLSFLHYILIQLTEVVINIPIGLDSCRLTSFWRWTFISIFESHLRHY